MTDNLDALNAELAARLAIADADMERRKLLADIGAYARACSRLFDEDASPANLRRHARHAASKRGLRLTHADMDAICGPLG